MGYLRSETAWVCDYRRCAFVIHFTAVLAASIFRTGVFQRPHDSGFVSPLFSVPFPALKFPCYQLQTIQEEV